MKPTEEQIKKHEEDYKKVRKEEWRCGVQMYLNQQMTKKQEEMIERGLKHYTWQWTYQTFKISMKLFKDLGLPYKYDWKNELTNFGWRSTLHTYLIYLIAKITWK